MRRWTSGDKAVAGAIVRWRLRSRRDLSGDIGRSRGALFPNGVDVVDAEKVLQ
jgi:hypothetical protein